AGDVQALRAQVGGDRGSTCQRLEVTVVVTAGEGGRVRHVHVAHIPGRPLRTALELPAGDNARADTGGDLYEYEVAHARPGDRVLAEGEDVHVVVDEHGDEESLLHVPGDIEAIPPRHDRGIGRATRRVFDRPRHTDTDADEPGGG